MCQLPEFKQFPLYHPSMTFSQVIPKLSSRGRDLLQVRTNEKRVYADFECLRICYHNLIVKIYNIFCILAFIDLQSCASVVSRWIYGASVLPRPQPFHQKLLANKKILTRMWLWSRIHLWFRLVHTFILILQISQIC